MKYAAARRTLCGFSIVCVAFFAFAALSSARSTSTSVNIVNNSNHEIRNLYLSHVDIDDWGTDQLAEGEGIAPGHSFTLNNIACDQQQVRVIGEDQDGCFLSTTVACGDNATWTITNDTAVDCGN